MGSFKDGHGQTWTVKITPEIEEALAERHHMRLASFDALHDISTGHRAVIRMIVNVALADAMHEKDVDTEHVFDHGFTDPEDVTEAVVEALLEYLPHNHAVFLAGRWALHMDELCNKRRAALDRLNELARTRGLYPGATASVG